MIGLLKQRTNDYFNAGGGSSDLLCPYLKVSGNCAENSNSETPTR